MPAFEYDALDQAGKRKKGVVSADSERMARRELRARRLAPTRLKPAQERDDTWLTRMRNRVAGETGQDRGQRLNTKALSIFTRQLATLVSASAPVEEALGAVAAQADDRAVKAVASSVRSRVAEGERLSQAMARHPKCFNPLYRAMVSAGETTGALGPVLERLAEYLESQRILRRKVVTALVYPAVLALVALVVVGILMAFVVPRVAAQYEDLGQDLPALTELMIALSAFVRDFGLLSILVILAAGLGLNRLAQRPAIAGQLDRLVLRLPLIGRLQRNLQAARLARTLSALIGAGTPVLEGLRAARETVRNAVMRKALDEGAEAVAQGKGLAPALRATETFPPLVIYMAAMGERTGTLAPMLDKSADYLEGELDAAVSTAMSLLEPGIIVVMGALVATIVLAIFLPILRFNAMAL